MLATSRYATRESRREELLKLMNEVAALLREDAALPGGFAALRAESLRLSDYGDSAGGFSPRRHSRKCSGEQSESQRLSAREAAKPRKVTCERPLAKGHTLTRGGTDLITNPML